MEQNLIYIVFFSVLLITIIKSEIALGILLNINLFRAIPFVNYQDPRYGYYLENDVLLGAVLPILCFFIMILRVFMKNKKARYKFDTFDFFMLLLTSIMVISIIVSPDKSTSVYYTGIFLVLGAPFFFITKFVFGNSKDLSLSLSYFVGSIVFFALTFSAISLYLHEIALYPYKRMTFPGVYPIPFCLFLTLALIICVVYYIKPKFRLNFDKKFRLFFSFPVLALIAFSIIKTNTRGPVVAMLLAFISLMFVFFKIKINPKFILGFIFTTAIGLFILVTFFDVEAIASRFVDLSSKDSNSYSPRLIGYMDSLRILALRPLGISVGTFGLFYSEANSSTQSGGYAHNLFMELISSFGIVGLLICVIIAVLILREYYFITYRQKEIFSNPMFFLVIVIFLFFFFETQISFTLNTHKGWYLSMALYSVFKSNFIKNNT